MDWEPKRNGGERWGLREREKDGSECLRAWIEGGVGTMIEGVEWGAFHGKEYWLKVTEMKISTRN